MNESTLERQFPWIEWRTPLRVHTLTHSGFACRYCIALVGLKAHDVAGLPQTEEDWKQHMREQHP